MRDLSILHPQQAQGQMPLVRGLGILHPPEAQGKMQPSPPCSTECILINGKNLSSLYYHPRQPPGGEALDEFLSPLDCDFRTPGWRNIHFSAVQCRKQNVSGSHGELNTSKFLYCVQGKQADRRKDPLGVAFLFTLGCGGGSINSGKRSNNPPEKGS